MAELLFKSNNGELFVYQTKATAKAEIKTELETSASFVCRDFQDRYEALLFKESIAAVIQLNKENLIALFGEQS